MEKGFLDKVEDNAAVRTWAEVYKHLFRALAQFWNTAYGCFTFGRVDLVPTVEEYTALLRCLKIQVDRAYSRAVSVPTFLKKLMSITGMSKQWVTARIKQKGDSKCIPWKNLKDIILAHPDTKKKIDVFVLSIYGLVIFPRLWDMLMRQSLTCSTDLIRGSRQFRRFWRKHSVISGKLIRFRIGSSLKTIRHKKK
ncbi:hypothetical protein Gotur_024089 [Gossypium turneri]